MNIKNLLLAAVAIAAIFGFGGETFAAGGGGTVTDPGAAEGKHFHPKGKMPSEFTVESQKKWRQALPFEDERDFEEQKKGFIAAPEYKQIMAEAGHVA